MKKSLIIILMLTVGVVFGQRKGKITGNKEVIETRGDLQSFNTIEIGDELEVFLNLGDTSDYTLVTDENLVPSIIFQVKDSVLSIFTANRITRSKKLDILVNAENLDKIILSNKAKLSATSLIRTNALKAILSEGAELEMDIKADSLTMELRNNSRAAFEYKGDRAEFHLFDNAFLDGDIDTATLHYNGSSRTDAQLKGVALAAIITSKDNAEVKARSLNTDTATVIGEGSGDVNLHVDKDLEIDLKGKVKFYLYGKPEDIKVLKFEDEAELLKRD